MNYLKTKKFIQSVIKSHTTRRLCFFNRKRKPNSRLVSAYIHCETIVIYLVKVTIRLKRQFNVLRNLYHVHNSFFICHKPFLHFLQSKLHLSIQRIATCEFRFDFLFLFLIDCNFIFYIFFIKNIYLIFLKQP